MRSYLFLLLASTALLFTWANTQIPAPRPAQDRNTIGLGNSGATGAPPAILANRGEAVASVVAANSESRNPKGEKDAPQGGASTEAAPTLEETLKWLVEKVGAAGYQYCQRQGKTLACQKAHYESVESGDCKLTFTSVTEMSAAGRQPFVGRSKVVLSLWSSSADISVSPSTFRCDKPCQSDFGDRETFFVGRPRVAGVYFASRDVAERVAKAMNHAIVLCGKEPF